MGDTIAPSIIRKPSQALSDASLNYKDSPFEGRVLILSSERWFAGFPA